ncbi:MAG: hypothetical protein WCH05_00910 [Chlorobiaceae bacterium]
MTTDFQKNPPPPGPLLWISITLLWGTLFYFTSVFMLAIASSRLGEELFDPSRAELFRVCAVHAGVLVIFALVAMMVKRLFEPGAEKQVQRRVAIREGRGEKLFISLAGSIASGFFFTCLTAGTFILSRKVTGIAVHFTLQAVLLAALFNIAAGLGASLFVGIVFLVAKVGTNKKY